MLTKPPNIQWILHRVTSQSSPNKLDSTRERNGLEPRSITFASGFVRIGRSGLRSRAKHE